MNPTGGQAASHGERLLQPEGQTPRDGDYSFAGELAAWRSCANIAWAAVRRA
jgi:hypothetical protein